MCQIEYICHILYQIFYINKYGVYVHAYAMYEVYALNLFLPGGQDIDIHRDDIW